MDNTTHNFTVGISINSLLDINNMINPKIGTKNNEWPYKFQKNFVISGEIAANPPIARIKKRFLIES